MAAPIAPSICLTPYSLHRTPKPYSLHRTPKHPKNPSKSLAIIALSSSSYRNESLPETDCPVPWDQQPVNEYTALSTSFPFSWVSADFHDYCTRLAVLGSSFSVLIGVPVAAFGGTQLDAFRCCLSAASFGIIAVMLVVIRMYLGWAYVGNRLLSATVEYEETGWYDGQIWVKTPEVLARDRLLGSFSVKPLLTRVKFTLIGLAISLAACVIIFIDVENPKNIPGNNSEKVIAGVYNDEAARSFEADAFCGESDLPQAS